MSLGWEVVSAVIFLVFTKPKSPQVLQQHFFDLLHPLSPQTVAELDQAVGSIMYPFWKASNPQKHCQ